MKRKKKREEAPNPSPGTPPAPTVNELIDKLSPEDTKTLVDILTNHENVRMVSTLESKTLLEKLVKGDK